MVVRNGVAEANGIADSGEDEVEVSDTTGESNVELLVVGELEPSDSENSDVILPRWSYGFVCCCVFTVVLVTSGKAFSSVLA